MIIAFTGHRNSITNQEELEKIVREYPDATWVHGGAIGFDTQVSEFAQVNHIKEIVLKPDYKKYNGSAPLIRNKKIVKLGDILIACYDGRQKGGTLNTINYAKKKDKQVILVSVCKLRPI